SKSCVQYRVLRLFDSREREVDRSVGVSCCEIDIELSRLRIALRLLGRDPVSRGRDVTCPIGLNLGPPVRGLRLGRLSAFRELLGLPLRSLGGVLDPRLG